MKTIKTLLTFIFIGLVALSCKDDEPATVNKEKAEAAFASANDAVAADLAALISSSGYTALNSLSALNSEANPFGRVNSAKPKDIAPQLKSIMLSFRSVVQSSSNNGRISSDEPFEYNTKKGIYEYNFDTEVFDKTGESTIVQIFFPTEGSVTNDGEFQLTAYEEVQDMYGYYNPTVLKASIKIDDVLQAEIDLSATYSGDGEQTKADLHLYLNPYTVDLAYDNTGATTTTLAFSFLKGTTVIIEAGINVTYTSKANGELTRVTGFLQLMNIRFDAYITENSQDITIKVDGANAGKIIFDETTAEPWVQFNDGTKVPLNEVFGDLTVQLDGLM